MTTHQVRVLHLLHNRDIVQLDVEVLVHALQRAAHRDVILELDGDLVVHQRLEETVQRKQPISQLGCFCVVLIATTMLGLARAAKSPGPVGLRAVESARARARENCVGGLCRGMCCVDVPEEQHGDSM